MSRPRRGDGERDGRKGQTRDRDGRALPAVVLASEAGVTASTASGHLGRLADAGLVSVVAQGRHRYYRLAGPHVAELIEALARVAPAAPAGRCATARARTRSGARARATTTWPARRACAASSACRAPRRTTLPDCE
jgi:DNA-binding transcriptional ArsR family regulator